MSAEIGVIMGSTSDWVTMQKACEILDELEIAYEKKGGFGTPYTGFNVPIC